MDQPKGSNNCRVCGQSFNSDQERMQHERNSHPESGKKPESGGQQGGQKERKTA